MIKNEKAGRTLLENTETLSEAAVQLYSMICKQAKSTNQFADTMKQLLCSMQIHLDGLYKEEPALMSHLICKNILYSLNNIMPYAVTDKEKACGKIQFELLPLIDELYTDLYFWGFCYPDREKIFHYYRNEMKNLCPLPIPEDGKYKYDVSLVVIAYNKLEYTKRCVEYLKRYFPKNVNYETILYNNGSSDGTKEFFESLHPDKQIDLQNNTKSWSIISRVVEGKYILTVSNDALILPNSVENLLKCIESDKNICCVMPTCPNIANLETIPASYSNEKEMIEFAERNNVSDPYRWEQRTRLNPPVLFGRSDSFAVHAFCTYLYPFSPVRFLAFSDDLMGLVARRNKQKCMLAKDAYVHHFGSVTINEATHQNQGGGSDFYTKCRIEFAKIFGVDPWGVGVCYDYELIGALNYEKNGPINILGINCGLGDTPLKIEAMLKEKMHNNNVKIYNITNMPRYRKDLDGLSDYFKLITNWNQIRKVFPGAKFTYIVAEDINLQIVSKKTMNDLFSRLSAGGMLAVKGGKVKFKSDKCVKEDRTEHWQIYHRD